MKIVLTEQADESMNLSLDLTETVPILTERKKLRPKYAAQKGTKRVGRG